jgi:integrase
MSLFKTPAGVWRYHFQHEGTRYTKSGFHSKKEAREAEAAHRAALQKGSQPVPNDLDLLTLAEEYLDANQRRLAEKTWKYKRFVFNSFLAHAGNVPVSGITSLVVDSYLRTRPSGYNANFHRKDLAALFSWGQKHDLCTSNPALQVDRFRADTARKVIPTPAEIAKIFVAAGEYAPLLKVILFTLARRSEALALRWEDINFQEGTVRLWTRKRRDGNLEADTLPMSDALRRVLNELWSRRTQEEWVFLNPRTGTRFMSRPKIMGTICKRAGTRHFGFHAIRHFGASYLLDVGKVSMKRIQHLLRHTQLRTTEIYLHRVDSSLREAVNTIPAPEEMVGG